MTKVFNPPPNWPPHPDGWTPPSGWRPDPAWGPEPTGWKFWIDAPWEQPAEAVTADEELAKPKKHRGWAWTLFLGLIVVGVIIYAVGTGGKFGALQLSPDGGVRIEFDNSVGGGSATRDEVEDAQPAIEEEVSDLEEEASGQPGTAQSAGFDVSGAWTGDNGYDYVFHQTGAYVIWQEQSDAYGVTGYGEGQIVGTDLQLVFQGLDGVTGSAELTYIDGRLTGTFSNSMGDSAAISMTRG